MELADFIDIHCHILPGLDDGPKNTAQCLDLVCCYTDVGIKRVVATPHFLPGTIWTARPRKILALIDKLQKALSDHGIQFEIIPGMEIAIQKNMGQRLAQGDYLPLGRSRTYLLEPPFEISDLNPLEPLAEFMEQDKKVILAHPERCEYFQLHPEDLRQAHGLGIAVQINCGSLFGRFGQPAQKLANQLLAWEVVDYLASDAHSAHHRRPPDGSEWNALQQLISPEILRRIAAVNPGKLLA
ncbi:MAG: hypothetical protein J7J71_03680 [Deltaproteobacteria bacterium]|nr:hypothetical protein [Candidatus Tharpella sp.]